jgi:hypothetical protein
LRHSCCKGAAKKNYRNLENKENTAFLKSYYNEAFNLAYITSNCDDTPKPTGGPFFEPSEKLGIPPALSAT